jgi:hypothetical protein
MAISSIVLPMIGRRARQPFDDHVCNWRQPDVVGHFRHVRN